MSNSSLREPKAPIVRIRKKKTKKKTKDNDIVHLPVRASQQTRYSSLTTSPNPQTKGRECCRTIFASCLKLPVCKTICFRCILPQCFRGEGSDDEEPEARDEGYHSQNRHSSELPTITEASPTPTCQGATGGRDMELTELKQETVKLVPPPRRPVNDYRRGPSGSGGSREHFSSAERQPADDSGEITYIEVESISFLSRSDRSSANDLSRSRERSSSKSSVGGACAEMDEEGYEEPIIAGVLGDGLGADIERELKSRGMTKDIEEFLPVSLTKSDASKTSKSDTSAVSVDSDDSETQYYVNEDILKRPACEITGSEPKLKLTKTMSSKQRALDYANVCATNKSQKLHTPEALHSKTLNDQTENSCSGDQETAEEQHNYINLDTVVSDSGQACEGKVVIPDGMVKTDCTEASILNRTSLRKISKSAHKVATHSVVSKKTKSDDGTVSQVASEAETVQKENVPIPTRVKPGSQKGSVKSDEQVFSDKKALLEKKRTVGEAKSDQLDENVRVDDDDAEVQDTDKTKLIG